LVKSVCGKRVVLFNNCASEDLGEWWCDAEDCVALRMMQTRRNHLHLNSIMENLRHPFPIPP